LVKTEDSAVGFYALNGESIDPVRDGCWLFKGVFGV
jgi:hypothetical protein